MANRRGDVVKDFEILDVNLDRDSKRIFEVRCVKCDRQYTLTAKQIYTKVCDCHKEIGKYNGQVIKGFLVLDGYCKQSKNGHSKAIAYRVQCMECGAISEKFRNCLFKEDVECRCDCKKIVRPGEERLHGIWASMKERCSNPNTTYYYRYGGRGITVCQEWQDSFIAFRDWAWANGYNDELSIDRIDNNGNYEPSNCRWATREVQANNTSTNHYITINDTTKTIAEWSKETGVPERTIWARLNLGWNEEDAVMRPVVDKKQPISEEHRQKIIAKRGRPVEKCDLNGNVVELFPTVVDAARSVGVNKSVIGDCCRGKQKTSSGFTWRYAENKKVS